MLRSILVGLDGSGHDDSALRLAIRWARRFDALLVGMGIVDEPGIHGPEESLVGGAFFERLDSALLADTRRKVEGALSGCAFRCVEAGVAFKPLEEVGTPYVEILEAARRHDLIMLGRQTHFRFGWEDWPDATVGKVLARSPRPLVVVPDELGDGESVVVAYDGSLQAAHTLYAFEASGLGQGREVQVLSVAVDKKDAVRRADRAVEFLRSHELEAIAHPLQSSRSPAEVILETITPDHPGLLVIGAYGQPILREFFVGSTTRMMLEKSPVPMLLYH